MSPSSGREDRPSRWPSSLRSRDGWARYFELVRPPAPHVHQIEPTNHCPYTCVMCPRSRKMKRELGFMDLSLFTRVVDEAAGFPEPVRSQELELFHFGESLLHPRIDTMVGHAVATGLRVVLSVNAPEFEPGIASKLLALRPEKIIISLDGFDEESYRAVRGDRADFGAATRNIEAAIRVRRSLDSPTRLVVRMILLELNQGRAPAFADEWKARGAEVELREFFPWTDREMVGLGRFEKYPPGMPCPFPWKHLVVQWDGNVVPCCRDHSAENVMGNVAVHSLKEIWNGPRYQELRRQHRTGDYGANRLCRDCMDLYFDP